MLAVALLLPLLRLQPLLVRLLLSFPVLQLLCFTLGDLLALGILRRDSVFIPHTVFLGLKKSPNGSGVLSPVAPFLSRPLPLFVSASPLLELPSVV
jgi:hypothetical protein